MTTDEEEHWTDEIDTMSLMQLVEKVREALFQLRPYIELEEDEAADGWRTLRLRTDEIEKTAMMDYDKIQKALTQLGPYIDLEDNDAFNWWGNLHFRFGVTMGATMREFSGKLQR